MENLDEMEDNLFLVITSFNIHKSLYCLSIQFFQMEISKWYFEKLEITMYYF